MSLDWESLVMTAKACDRFCPSPEVDFDDLVETESTSDE